MDIIVGTAGHIDHGKTALVKALTGTDADRLPEEKQRGITVDLGFAEMSVGDVHFGFVDVPGHERFVKNMLAGASGIDIVLLVIAADEGVMPQTREHFDICRLLGIKNGVIALTKSDLVDAETLELAHLDVAELVAGSFLQNAPVVAVSSKSGDGINELKEEIIKVSSTLNKRDDNFIARLPIDRSFTMKGFGAVVTGTLASGRISEGDELELLPYERRVRVRGLQTHGRAAKLVRAGQRVAVNLAGIDHTQIERGMTLTEAGVLAPTQIIDSEIEVLESSPKPIRSRQRVRVHLGTAEILARVQVLNHEGEIKPGTRDLAQIRFERPVAPVPFERFIVRSYSPQITIAGGSIIDVAAQKRRRRELDHARDFLMSFLAAREDTLSQIQLMINRAGDNGLGFNELRSRTGLNTQLVKKAVDEGVASGQIIDAGAAYIGTLAFKRLTETVLNAIDAFHKREPLASGVLLDELRASVAAQSSEGGFRAVLASLTSQNKIVVEKERVRKSGQSIELTEQEKVFVDTLKANLKGFGLLVPKFEELVAETATAHRINDASAKKLAALMIKRGEIIKVSDEICFADDVIMALRTKVLEFADRSADRQIDVTIFKDLAGISRKYAIPLLEYFDGEKFTIRVGYKRLIR
jgi:selenocysteine-specific elongation factor